MTRKLSSSSIGPAIVVFVITMIMVLATIIRAGGDPLILARIGTRYAQGDPNGTEGYDGQFVYFIARNPVPLQVADYLDIPAYRYQRILLPILTRILSLGSEDLLPWVIPFLGILSLVVGTWAVGELLVGWGVSHWYALVYGLWAGFLLALLTDLPEPLAYGLVAVGILAIERKKPRLGWCLLGLSIFAKEVTMLFVVAGIFVYLATHRWKESIFLSSIGILPFLIFQFWLWLIFDRPGIGSGGAMATPFEWIPFMGLLRIGSRSMIYLVGMLIVFFPMVVLPVVWGFWQSVNSWLASERNLIVAGLFFNALILPFSPFSTFRETGGIIRLASGLVLAVLLFAGRYHKHRALNYSIFWLVLNVFLTKS